MELGDVLRKIDALCAVEDPAAAPFASKYEARRLLEDALGHVASQPSPSTDTVAYLSYRLGVNHVVTEEVSTGERLLARALEHFSAHSGTPNVVLGEIDAHNQMAVIWAGRHEWTEAHAHLQASLQAAQRWEQAGRPACLACAGAPDYAPESAGLASGDDRGSATGQGMHHLQTMTHFLLAQVLASMGDADAAAQHAHETLRRQLAFGQAGSALAPAAAAPAQVMFEPLSWAANSASLAVVYVRKRDFPMAAHLGDCAQYALDAWLAALPAGTGLDERVRSLQADLAIGKGQLQAALLELAAQLSGTGDDEAAQRRVLGGVRLQASESSGFFALPVAPRSFGLVRTWAEALAQFRLADEAFERGLQFYVLDGFVSRHVDVSQQRSAALGSLAALAPDCSTATKLLKRRARLLEPLVKVVSPAHYRNAWLAMTHEIGTCYARSFELKSLECERDAQAHSDVRLNEVATCAIVAFSLHIEEVDRAVRAAGEATAATAVSAIDDAVLPCYAHARQARAKLYERLHARSPDDRRKNLECALAEYRWLADYARAHAPAPDVLDPSVAKMCDEMVELLPQLIAKL